MRLQYLLLSLSFVFEVVKNEPHQQNIRKFFSSAAAGDRAFSKPFVESYWETWVLKVRSLVYRKSVSKKISPTLMMRV